MEMVDCDRGGLTNGQSILESVLKKKAGSHHQQGLHRPQQVIRSLSLEEIPNLEKCYVLGGLHYFNAAKRDFGKSSIPCNGLILSKFQSIYFQSIHDRLCIDFLHVKHNVLPESSDSDFFARLSSWFSV